MFRLAVLVGVACATQDEWSTEIETGEEEALSLIQLRAHKHTEVSFDDEAHAVELATSEHQPPVHVQVDQCKRCFGPLGPSAAGTGFCAYTMACARANRMMSDDQAAQNEERQLDVCTRIATARNLEQKWVASNDNNGCDALDPEYVPPAGDNAAAVGDPHMQMTNGKEFDYTNLLQETRSETQDAAALDEELVEWAAGTEESLAEEGSQRPMREIAAEMGLEKLGNRVRCSGQFAQRAKFGTFQQCVDALGGGDNTYLGFWIHNNRNRAVRGVCIAWSSEECNQGPIQRPNKNTLYRLPKPEPEVAAVGDPHLSQKSGARADLCCDGGHCKACP